MAALSRSLIAVLAIAALPAPAAEVAPDARAALADIKGTLGFVPGFLSVFPEEGLPGAWDEFKSVQLNRQSAIPPKYKELIGLGVAAQIPCEYCVYFHTRAAKANGATDREIREAVGMAAIVRHWSTYLNGAQIDEPGFRSELEQVIANVKAGNKAPAPAAITDAASAREDIRATLGIVPAFFASFPDAGVAGAWREMKGLQMNPNTAIPPKYKELIGLGVAAQIPCRYCVAFHTRVSTALDGASQAEVQEALAMAAIVRHWSTFLNGAQIDKAAFRAEVDRVMAPAKKSARLQAAQR
jgi:AhpD family alkylhydroperoxidase